MNPDGLLLLDKPAGLSSTAALGRARRALGLRKAGHTGTLDPFATGLLLLCFGEATKFAGYGLDANKSYRATLRLGIATDSADCDGLVIESRPVALSAGEVERAMRRFVGRIEQRPPMYSALKVAGRPLYAYARAGVEVERALRAVDIHRLEFGGMAGDLVEFSVTCSKGTYIRSLAADIGQALGCGAHLVALRRLRVGPFEVSEAVDLATLQNQGETARHLLLPPERLLGALPRLNLDPPRARRFASGQAVEAGAQGRVAVFAAADRLLGIGEADPNGWIHPRRVLAAAAGQVLNSMDTPGAGG